MFEDLTKRKKINKIKVLFVLGGKQSALHKDDEINGISFYIKEQADALAENGIIIDYFRFKLSSKFDVLRKIVRLRKLILSNNYDLIHAHYGVFGFLASLVKGKKPLVVTYHGSDINIGKNRILSSLAIKFSNYSIFVSDSLYNKAIFKSHKNNFSVLPCGVEENVFFPIEKEKARELLGLDSNKIYILFPSNKSNPIKNFSLAENSLNLLEFDFELIELIKKSREEVNLIMNASDVLILTSHSEGSPQVIKEALFTNIPIISVDVGDVRDNINYVENCYVLERSPEKISEKINHLKMRGFPRSNGRNGYSKFSNTNIAKEISLIYRNLITTKYD